MCGCRKCGDPPKEYRVMVPPPVDASRDPISMPRPRAVHVTADRQDAVTVASYVGGYVFP